MKETRRFTAAAENQSKQPSQTKNTKKRSGRPQLTRLSPIRKLIVEKSTNYLKTPTEISRELNVSRETVSRIIKRFEETGTTSYKPLGGDLKSIIQEHHKKFIIDTIDNNDGITLKELRSKVLDEFDDIKSISISTLWKFLKQANKSTLKKSISTKEQPKRSRNTLKEKSL